MRIFKLLLPDVARRALMIYEYVVALNDFLGKSLKFSNQQSIQICPAIAELFPWVPLGATWSGETRVVWNQ